MWSHKLSALVGCVLLIMTRGVAAAPPAGGDIPVRMVALGTGLPFLITTVWKERGIDKKYGLDLSVEQSSNLTQQWNVLRAGGADVVMGNFLDLLRQHQQGLKVRAFAFCYNYDDPVVTLADKPYSRLSDLKGARVGVTNTTELPVLLYRAAGKKAYGFDLVKDTQISQASPVLLPQLLRKGQLDATYTFRSLVFQDLVDKKLKEIANLVQVVTSAGLNVPLVLCVVTDAWRDKYGSQAVGRLAAAAAEVNQTLRTSDTGWAAYAAQAHVAAANLPQFEATFRKLLEPNYGAQALEPMQKLVDEMSATVGASIVGVTKVDPGAFDFESMKAVPK